MKQKVSQSLPKALSGPELDRVNHYRHFRSLIRDGPLFTVLDPGQLTDDRGRVNKRSGFDPFDGMPSYSQRYQKPKRLVPDLSTRQYGKAGLSRHRIDIHPTDFFQS
jgi:DNA-directed RNA polymerase III subunit RPC7